MVHVIAVVTARPGQRDAILKEFRANIPKVRRSGTSSRAG